jgi:hypothetical protein
VPNWSGGTWYLRAAALALAVLCAAQGRAVAQDGELAPLAGQEYRTTLFGQTVEVPPRDRRHVVAANFGLLWIPNGPTFYETLPFGSLYIWHNWEEERTRLRATISVAFNDIQYTRQSRDGWETILTFTNIVIPFGRSEYVEGQRISGVDIQWNQVYGGAGIGYRTPLAPGHQDSAMEMTLTYEPGYLWFQRSHDTAPSFKTPSDTLEHRVRFKMRADTLDRNLMELPHRGFSGGADVLYGRRQRWNDWGQVGFEAPDVARQREYLAVSAYALAAGGVPFVESDMHRLIASLYGGIGKDLDRFSAFRLPGRPTGYEWEAISRPVLPGVAFNELFPTKYGIADLMYRYQALFFVYPYVRANYAIVERPRFQPNGTIRTQMDSLPSLGGGIVSGAPWRSQIELNYSYNFGIFRDPGGTPREGGHSFFFLWSKELGRCSKKLVSLSDC